MKVRRASVLRCRPLALARLASLAAFVGCLCLWFVSFPNYPWGPQTADGLPAGRLDRLGRWDGGVLYLCSRNGKAQFQWIAFGSDLPDDVIDRDRFKAIVLSHHGWTERRDVKWSALGVTGLAEDRPPEELRTFGRGYKSWWSARVVEFSFWHPLLLSGLLPASWVVGRVRWAMRGRTAGLCRQCGYDLRATPSRCPECGATTEATSHQRPAG